MSKEIDLSETVGEVKEQVRESEEADLEEILEEEKKGKDRKTLKEFIEKEIEERPEQTESEEKEEEEPFEQPGNNNPQGVNLSVKQFAGLSFSAGFLLGVALTLSVVALGGFTFSDSNPPEDNWEDSVTLEDRPFLGDEDAPVTIISYEDFFCPFCAAYNNPNVAQEVGANTAFQEIKENHIDTGEVKYYYANLPVVGGDRPAIASECVASQSNEAFWDFHEWHFENFNQLRELYQENPENYDSELFSFVGDINIDQGEFEQCYNSQETGQLVQQLAQEGQNLGASATPTVFIEGEMLEGAQPYSSYETVINDKLQQ